MALKEEQVIEAVFTNRVKLLAFMRSIVCDFHVAEDLFQRICLLTLQAKEKFDDTECLLKWVWVVSRNESLKYLRDQKKQPLIFNETILAMIQDESEKKTFLDNPETMAVLEKCIAKLSTPVRELLDKRYKQNLTGAKLAEALNRKTNSVYVAVSRAHRSLYNCMQKKIRTLKE